MSVFNKCRGKMFCRDNGEKCMVCGRSMHEIVKTHEMMGAMAALAQELDYDNFQEFLDYLAEKSGAQVAHSLGITSRERGLVAKILKK